MLKYLIQVDHTEVKKLYNFKLIKKLKRSMMGL